MFTTHDVIGEMDKCNADAMGFPWLDHGYFYLADVRLSAYRDQARWAVVIETLVADNHQSWHQHWSTVLYCYGDRLPNGPGVSYPALNVTGDGPSGLLFDPDDIMGQLISPMAIDMRIRNEVVTVTTDPLVYTAARIQLSEPPRVQGYELLRLLAPAHRRLLFATEVEIAQRIGAQMPLLLRLDEWRHPNSSAGEKPSDVEAFRMVAAAIAENNADVYRPTERPNTHWSNWPMGGSL